MDARSTALGAIAIAVNGALIGLAVWAYFSTDKTDPDAAFYEHATA